MPGSNRGQIRPACKIRLKTCHSVLLPLFWHWLVAASGDRSFRHSRPCCMDFLRILERHARRFPAPRLGDRRQVNIQRSKVLCRTDASRMSAHLLDHSGRQSDPLRHAFEDRCDAPRIQRAANLAPTN